MITGTELPRRIRRAVVLAACSLAVAFGQVAPAHAQSKDPAAAEALFREGRALSDAGDIAGACAKFRESDRLDPAVGTTFNIADCEERLGHLATAWTLFDEVSQRLPASDKRRSVAQGRAATLEPRLPKLNIHLSAAAAAAGARVARDGVELGSASQGTPLPVNPGAHVVVVSVPGRADRTFKLVISEREMRSLEVEPGEPKDAPGTGTPKPASPREGSKTLGYVVGGVGIAGLVTAAIAGALVLQKKGIVDDHCNAAKRCDDEGLRATKAGTTLGIVTTAGLVTGVVGVGGGAYLIVSAGSREAPRSASVTWTGRF